ncbi:MAG: mechanosensitive ion channel, partial [Campylobacteraceae bacterium]|nr:mechanosensitive ion channel [Campylobacteraceae bacterium]
MQEVQKSLKKNILIKKYNSYLAYREISKELDTHRAKYKKYSKWAGEKYKELSYNLNNKIRIRENELELISEYKESPIGKLITPHVIEQFETITNPFGIINAWSYIKKLQNYKKQFKGVNSQVSNLLSDLELELDLYLGLYALKPSTETKNIIKQLDKRKKDFVNVLDIVSTTDEVYTRKIEEVIIETKTQISNQVEKTITILIIIFLLFVVSFLLKLALKKYFSQNENYYMANKVINFILVFLILLIIMFSFIENVSYLVTILGFASAGIAIALKDWFMSIFGWMVIVTSGSIHVGDRIKVQRNGIEAVGDVLDISLFKITIREDITYTSYVKNRRTGRIF